VVVRNLGPIQPAEYQDVVSGRLFPANTDPPPGSSVWPRLHVSVAPQSYTLGLYLSHPWVVRLLTPWWDVPSRDVRIEIAVLIEALHIHGTCGDQSHRTAANETAVQRRRLCYGSECE
jgi:hypothetical protein